MDDPAFTTTSLVDDTTQLLLLHAAHHDLQALKPLLRIPGNASLQDPETGYTPLHAAIAACGAATSSSLDDQSRLQVGVTVVGESEGGKGEIGVGEEGVRKGDGNEEEEEVDMEKAKDTIRELFLSGAIWNDLDANNETPGCLAWRLGRRELYELVVQAGVRAEMLLGLMGGYEMLGDKDSEEEGEEEELNQGEGEDVMKEEGDGGDLQVEHGTNGETTTSEEKKDVNSADYLKSELKFEDDKLLDADDNGVMMAWETDIMRRTADLLHPSLQPGARILNIGFGMGIIDRMFAATAPLTHHIIEAHPSVLAKLDDLEHDFGKRWEDNAPEGGRYVVHKGRWQDVIPRLLEEGEVFDVIYFDTFGEDYAQLKLFFTECVLGLLDPEGRFGWFNGLGADRRVCYDVYCRVVELDLCDAGLDVEWTNVAVELAGEGEGEWQGVRRRYWTLDTYRLPVCRFLG